MAVISGFPSPVRVPVLRVWMQESVPLNTCICEKPGHWVGEDHFPSPRIVNRELPLNRARVLDGPATPGAANIASPLWVGLGAGEVGRYGIVGGDPISAEMTCE